MTSDRDLIIDAVEEAQRILAEYLEPGSMQHASRTIHRLVVVLERPDLVAALRRHKAQRGFRILK
jgi:hypothetical protein